MLRSQYCLENPVTDGGEVVSPTHRPRSTPQKYYFSASCAYFCQRLSKPRLRLRKEKRKENLAKGQNGRRF
jgi:hypothetical protein